MFAHVLLTKIVLTRLLESVHTLVTTGKICEAWLHSDVTLKNYVNAPKINYQCELPYTSVRLHYPAQCGQHDDVETSKTGLRPRTNVQALNPCAKLVFT